MMLISWLCSSGEGEGQNTIGARIPGIRLWIWDYPQFRTAKLASDSNKSESNAHIEGSDGEIHSPINQVAFLRTTLHLTQ